MMRYWRSSRTRLIPKIYLPYAILRSSTFTDTKKHSNCRHTASSISFLNLRHSTQTGSLRRPLRICGGTTSNISSSIPTDSTYRTSRTFNSHFGNSEYTNSSAMVTTILPLSELGNLSIGSSREKRPVFALSTWMQTCRSRRRCRGNKLACSRGCKSLARRGTSRSSSRNKATIGASIQ